MMEYGIYYRATLSPDGKLTVGSELKSKQQFEAELKNMKEHGVVLPTCYTGFSRKPDGTFDFTALERHLQIRKRLGLNKGPIVLTRYPFSFYEFVKASEERRKEIIRQAQAAVRALNDFLKRGGYPKMALYGIDEASGETLKKERELFKAVVEAGGMTTAACGWDFWVNAGGRLTFPVVGRQRRNKGKEEVQQCVNG